MKRVKCRRWTTKTDTPPITIKARPLCKYFDRDYCMGAKFMPQVKCNGNAAECEKYPEKKNKYRLLNELDEAYEWCKANEWEISLTVLVAIEKAIKYIEGDNN